MATGSKWKKSTVNVDSVQEKLDARNKVIELKAKYEELTPRLAKSVYDLFQFLMKKPEVSDKFDFSHFSTVKDVKIAETTEEFYKNQFTSLPKLQQNMLKLLYLLDMEKDIDKLSSQVMLLASNLKELVQNHDIIGSLTYKWESKKFKLPATYKAYFDWFKDNAWALRDTNKECLSNDNLKLILGAEIEYPYYSSKLILGAEIKYPYYSSKYGYDVLKTNVAEDALITDTMKQDHMNTQAYIDLQHVISALDAVEKMHEAYEEILTLAEDMDGSTLAPQDTKEATTTFLNKMSAYFGSFFSSPKPKTAEPKQTGSNESVKEEEAETHWYDLFYTSSSKKKVETETEYVDVDVDVDEYVYEGFDAESAQVSTNVVEYSVDSVETQTTIHSRYQLYVSKFLETAKLHCFGKVIASQLLLANCQAYRLSTGKKDIECKNIETMVKIFTDHCQYAFPFETEIDEHINTELLEAIKIKTKILSDGQLGFSGAGQEYASGFVIDSSKTDAKEILGPYVKYVPQRIIDETEVLALPSSSNTINIAITDGH